MVCMRVLQTNNLTYTKQCTICPEHQMKILSPWQVSFLICPCCKLFPLSLSLSFILSLSHMHTPVQVINSECPHTRPEPTTFPSITLLHILLTLTPMCPLVTIFLHLPITPSYFFPPTVLFLFLTLHLSVHLTSFPFCSSLYILCLSFLSLSFPLLRLECDGLCFFVFFSLWNPV